jgi:hypothetical protein
MESMNPPADVSTASQISDTKFYYENEAWKIEIRLNIFPILGYGAGLPGSPVFSYPRRPKIPQKI